MPDNMNGLIDEEGLSPAMGIVLMLAITVLITAFFHSGIDLKQIEAPVFAFLNSENKLLPHETGMQKESQIIKITNIAGESIEVEKIELTVYIYRNNTMLMMESCRGFPVKKFGDAECHGDDFIDKSYLGFEVLGELHFSSDRIFSAGEFIGFRIKATSNTGIKLEKGDRIVVQIADTGSGFTIARIERKI